MFLGIGWFSGMKMLWFLVDEGEEKSKVYSFNPLLFLKYIDISKKKHGKIGIWFKVQFASFIFGMINLIFLILLYGEA
jgi:hypothetical protein